jgi:hypothetical protein
MTTTETRTLRKAVKRQQRTWAQPCPLLRRLHLERLFTPKESYG